MTIRKVRATRKFIYAVMFSTCMLSTAHAGYIAFAAGFDKVETDNGTVSNVSIGYGRAFSRREAKSVALQQCIENIGNCKVVETFNFACGYITTCTERNEEGKGTVAYGFGPSRSDAKQNCAIALKEKTYGLSIKQPIGGCVY